MINNKWLKILYTNKEKETTDYYIGIKNINIGKGQLLCDLFNPFKSINTINSVTIDINSIKWAEIANQSYYETPADLLKKINNNITLANYLEISNFDNNILEYLSECFRLDNDPFLKEVIMIDDIDIKTLSQNGKYKLSTKQFNIILDRIFKKNTDEIQDINRYQEFAINRFSIDINKKQYVVAYRTLNLDLKNKTLVIGKRDLINKSFLIEEQKKVTLSMYLNVSPDEFISIFDTDPRAAIELIKENFYRDEKVNTRPNLFLLKRNSHAGVDRALESIHEMDIDNKLTFPLKSFFGRSSARSGTNKDVALVVFNKNKINIDQMRVVYNAMSNHVTFVKGPPGTGKTETIFNVLLSAYANNKTVLVCSNNNHPVNDIFIKMSNSFFKKNFKSQTMENILFPIIRLGNNDEMIKALNRLGDIIAFAKENENSAAVESTTEMSKDKFISKTEELRKLISEYESQVELSERIDNLHKIRKLIDIPQLFGKLDDQIGKYQAELRAKKVIENEEVTKYAISASEDNSFMNFIYYSSLLRFKKLLGNTYKGLRDILVIENDELKISEFNKYLQDSNNLKRFLAIFPIIICTNLSSDKLSGPAPHFDLCIMDEAGQCNIASSLIPIVRANNLLLVGDTNQLQPVTVIEENVHLNLLRKYDIKEDYNYIHNSILSTMLRKDNNSKSILLSYHYRCGRKIANFVNKRFYETKLKLLNQKEGNLIYVNVENQNINKERNSYINEAKAIVNIIVKNKYKDVGIITPFVNQANLINRLLEEQNINNIQAGTVHTLQGSEKSVIILSSALSPKTGKKTMEWIKNNHELINVAVTRAKDTFIFVGDKKAIDILSEKDENDLKVLSDYVYKNGLLEVPKSPVILFTDFSNNSENEREFFETVKPYFNRRGSKFRIERNVPVSEAIKSINTSELENTFVGRKEFDFIVQVSTRGLLGNGRYQTLVAFEIDGGEHVGNKKIAARDRQKEQICKSYGIKLIRIANSQVKDYESIVALFEMVIKGIDNMDEVLEQGNLFNN